MVAVYGCPDCTTLADHLPTFTVTYISDTLIFDHHLVPPPVPHHSTYSHTAVPGISLLLHSLPIFPYTAVPDVPTAIVAIRS